MMSDPRSLASEAQALQAAGKLDEALTLRRRIVSLAPASVAAHHNLAAILGDLGRWREASSAIEAAFARGGDAAQSWLVRARSLQALGHFDEAETAFKQALRRSPQLYDALRDLTQLRWMRTGSAGDALPEVDAAIAAAESDPRLRVLKGQALEYMGDLDGALALLSSLAAAMPSDAFVVTAAAQIAAVAGDDANALKLAERAALLAPGDQAAKIALIVSCLAVGDAERASALADDLRKIAPTDQHALALQATAWRLLGDSRYRTLYDYEGLVSAQQLDAPKSWRSVETYLADVTESLNAAHRLIQHPFNQSVRNGSQVADVLHLDAPALRALPQALDGPIKRHLEHIGTGDDPCRARNAGGYDYQGLWSIRMSAGGFHVDHIHPRGWLSSACYFQLPERRVGKEGWIKFGQPGVRTSPPLDAEHFVEPKVGTVVLFPSYMWHGTVPFAEATTRMTIAFDLSPR